jgi:arsenate reductase
MAESILAKDGGGRFRAFSAGSHPNERVNPLALETLVTAGYPVEGLQAKPWDIFGNLDAPHMDYVITVCDKAAAEASPAWPGQPARDHWSVPNPAAFVGSNAGTQMTFLRAFETLKARIATFIDSN